MSNEAATKVDFPEIQESFGLIGKSFLELHWHYILMGLGVLIIFAIILYYILKPKPKKISAYEKAIASMEKLKDLDLDDKFYLSSLSDIIRAFVEEHYHVAALGRTSIEFISLIEDSADIDEKTKLNLAELLKLADFVKFTGQSIEKDQRETVQNKALEILEKSKEQKESK